MITIQGFKESNDSIFMLFDKEGINEMIKYLEFVRDEDSSIHLNGGNELSLNNNDVEDDMFVIPHVKIINVDRLS